MNFIDLRIDTDGAGSSRSVTAQEFLQSEAGERRYSDDGGYIVLESGKILFPCGVGRFYDDETKTEYCEIVIDNVIASYDSSDAASLEFETINGYGTGRYIKI